MPTFFRARFTGRPKLALFLSQDVDIVEGGRRRPGFIHEARSMPRQRAGAWAGKEKPAEAGFRRKGRLGRRGPGGMLEDFQQRLRVDAEEERQQGRWPPA